MVETYEVIFDSERWGRDCLIELQALSSQNVVDTIRKLYSDDNIMVRSVKKLCFDWN